MQRNIPTALEMEEFFEFAEQQQRRIFIEKYILSLYTIIQRVNDSCLVTITDQHMLTGNIGPPHSCK